MRKEEEKHSYLVIKKLGPDGMDEKAHEYAQIMSAAEIFDEMDMSDCFDIEIDVYRIRPFGKRPEHCRFLGKWHDHDSPLKMKIVSSRGRTLDTGYGTDH